VVRHDKDADRVDPDEGEFEDDEYVPLRCQRAAGEGDGGGDGVISSLGASF
jgi:hypothetical protein